jgi:hypothetical protein
VKEERLLIEILIIVVKVGVRDKNERQYGIILMTVLRNHCNGEQQLVYRIYLTSFYDLLQFYQYIKPMTLITAQKGNDYIDE